MKSLKTDDGKTKEIEKNFEGRFDDVTTIT